MSLEDLPRDAHVCPECRDGKCWNCDGRAWCLKHDADTACACTHEGGGR